MSSLLKKNRNCWRIENADRLSFLIDGADYFAVLREAMKSAQHTIYIIGWDINSKLELVRGEVDDGYPKALGELLNTLTDKKQNLNIYILNWDFAMIYAAGREWLPIYQLDWKTHSRIHFCLDGSLPSGASQHQKSVIIDDTLAFIGGLDLTMGRWDTSDHIPDNPKRDCVDNKIAMPFHDVQVMLEGNAATALAELFRERWQLATEKKLQPVNSTKTSGLWPNEVSPDLSNLTVGLARTRCAYKQLAEVCEIRNFYLDAISTARNFIYIENQYFTVPSIAEALQGCLEKEQGPEIVIVQPRETDGWLSQITMDVLRVRLIKQLQEHDKYNRLKVYYPDGPGLTELPINVHAKVMIVDDRLVTVGSANLNNRSMGLDNECNIIIDAKSDETLVQNIAAFHHRLLSEHLSCTPQHIQEALRQTNSLIACIEKLTDTKNRFLNVLPLDLSQEIDRIIPDTDVADPEKPLEPELFLNRILPDVPEKPIKSNIINWLLIVGVITALVAVWQWTPLGRWIELPSESYTLTEIRAIPALPIWIVVGFVLAGFARAPISLLVIATVSICGLLQGFIYSLIGGLLSAFIFYTMGKKLHRETIRKLTGSRLNSINKKLVQHGIISIVAIRIIPVAPFTLINLVAGASHFHFRDFIAGTTIGMLPGILAVSFLTDHALATIENPSPENLILLIFTVITFVTVAYLLMNWIRRKARYHGQSAKN